MPAEHCATEAQPHRRFFVNVVANFGGFLLNLAFGLWFTPFVVHRLGVAVYGLIPLANSVTNYFSVIGVAVSGSVGRYVTLDLARGDTGNGNRTFNTFLFGSLVVIAALVPLGAGLVWVAPHLFDIPGGQQFPLQILIASMVVAFLLALLGSCFDSAIWVTSRFDIRNVIEGAATVTRVGCVFALFYWLGAQLWQVGAATVIAALVAFSGQILAWRKLTPNLRISRAAFDRTRLPALWHTSRWLFLNQAGMLMFSNLDLVLINILIGAPAAGFYAPVVQWTVLLRSVSMQISIVVAPSVIQFHARDEAARVEQFLGRSVRLLSFLVALPAGLACGLAEPTLRTWLGPSFVPMAPLVWVALLPLTIETTTMLFGTVLLAQDRVRWMAVSTFVSGLVNLGLGLLLAAGLHLGVWGIAIGSATASLIRHFILLPVHVARRFGLPWYAYMPRQATAPAAAALVGLAGWALSGLLPGRSWLGLCAAAAAIALPYSVVIYCAALNQEERQTVRRILAPLGLG